MKIAMIGHKRVPSREGGIEVVVEQLAVNLASRGHTVDVMNRMGRPYSALASGYDAKAKTYKGVRLITIFTIPIPALEPLVYSFFATLRALFGGYDLVHYHAEGCCVMLPILRAFGVPVVATIHGLDWQREKWKRFARWYLRLGEEKAAKKASELIVLSHNMQHYFKETYGRESNYIPNGITPPSNDGADDLLVGKGLNKGEYILLSARIVPEKGLHFAIEAFSRVETDLKLVILGDTTYHSKYLDKLREMAQNDKRVMLMGFVQGQLLEQLYTNCALFLLPSTLEGMSLSFLEALVSGCRCMASDISENTELGGDYTHYFAAGSVDALAEALEGFVAGHYKFPPAKEQAAHFIGKYSWEAMTNQTFKVYEQAVAEQQN